MKKMKRMIVPVLILMLFVGLMLSSGCKKKAFETVNIGGSPTVEKILNALIYGFQKEHDYIAINYEPNNSSEGIRNTESGLYEIGYSSRDLEQSEKDQGLEAVLCATEGIAIVVHNKNDIIALTNAQIYDIYTGRITNWQDVGGLDAEIKVITYEKSSGTRAAMEELTGLEVENRDETKITSAAKAYADAGAIQSAIISDPNAIGYLSFSDFVQGKVKPIQYEDVSISKETLKSGEYKLNMKFWMIIKEYDALSKSAKTFFDFVLSYEGQRLLENRNFLPIK